MGDERSREAVERIRQGPLGDGVRVLRGENARGRRTGFPRRGRQARTPSRRPCGVRRQNRSLFTPPGAPCRWVRRPRRSDARRASRPLGALGMSRGRATRDSSDWAVRCEVEPEACDAGRVGARLRGTLLFHVKPAGGEALVAGLGRMRTWVSREAKGLSRVSTAPDAWALCHRLAKAHARFMPDAACTRGAGRRLCRFT
jgi:hypothetical protein